MKLLQERIFWFKAKCSATMKVCGHNCFRTVDFEGNVTTLDTVHNATLADRTYITTRGKLQRRVQKHEGMHHKSHKTCELGNSIQNDAIIWTTHSRIRNSVSKESRMFHCLGRKTPDEVLHDVDQQISTDRAHTYCLSPFSISTSSSGSRFLTAINDCLGRRRSL